MLFQKTLTTVALASSLSSVAAQGLQMPTESDGLNLKVSQAVAYAMRQSPLDLSLPTGYMIGGDKVNPVVTSSGDTVQENLTWLQQQYLNPCREIEKTFAQNAQCQVSQKGFTDSLAGRDVRDWQMRKAQVDFTNNLAKKFLGDVVTLTEGTPTEPSRIVWLQHWRARIRLETPNDGFYRPTFEAGYYRRF